jgi:hypothetical protein
MPKYRPTEGIEPTTATPTPAYTLSNDKNGKEKRNII